MSQVFNTNNPGIGDVYSLTVAETEFIDSLLGLSYVEGDVIYIDATGNFNRLAIGTDGQVLTVNDTATAPQWETPAAGGDVSAASAFGTDNVLIRSDGTAKGVQSTGVSVDDSNNTFVPNGAGLVVGHTSKIATAQTHELQVLGTGAGDTGATIGSWRATANGAHIDFVKSRNTTIGSNTIVQDNDRIGILQYFPDDGVDFATQAARFFGEVDDASPAAGDVGMAFVWDSMPGGGGVLREVMRISAAGDLSLAVGGIDIAASNSVSVAGTDILADSAGTMTLSNIDALDATTEATIEAAIDTLANLTTATSLGTVSTALTGVLRADSGVLSADTDVTDLVTAASDSAAGKVELATTTETNTGTSTTLAVTPDGLSSATKSIMLTAAGGAPLTTAGCSEPTKVEAATNDINYYVLDFDSATEEHAFWSFVMPENWDAGTVTAQFYWTNASGLTTETVDWGIAGGSWADGDAIDAALGTEVTTTDTWLAQGDLHISPKSTAVTIANATAGEWVNIVVARKVASDNLTGDARLIAVKLTYTIDQYSDEI